MEVVEDRGDVFTAADGGEQSSGRVLNILEFIEDIVGWAIEDAVAVAESGGYEGMDEIGMDLGGGRGQRGPEAFPFENWEILGVGY